MARSVFQRERPVDIADFGVVVQVGLGIVGSAYQLSFLFCLSIPSLLPVFNLKTITQCTYTFEEALTFAPLSAMTRP